MTQIGVLLSNLADSVSFQKALLDSRNFPLLLDAVYARHWVPQSSAFARLGVHCAGVSLRRNLHFLKCPRRSPLPSPASLLRQAFSNMKRMEMALQRQILKNCHN